MKIAQIVFPERRPRTSDFFDYIIPDAYTQDVREGTTVVVPFRSTEKTGVIINIRASSAIEPKKLRPISEIQKNTPLITDTQLTLLNWIRDKTGSSYATVLHAMVPQKPKRATYHITPLTLQPQKTKIKKTAIISESRRDENIEIQKLLSRKKIHALLIVPELSQISVYEKLLRDLNPLVYTGQLNLTRRFSAWQKTYNGEPHIVIGTRQALLLPFRSLDTVLLLDEPNSTHQRTDQHPDVDSRELAKKVAELHGAQIQYIGPSLTIESFREVLGAIRRIPRSRKPKIHIIDSNIFTQKRQSPILPDDLIQFLKRAKKKSFLLYNRKGLYRKIYCADCGWEPTCTQCKNSFLSETSSPGILTCRVCRTKNSIPAACPHCGNPNITFAYPGIEQIFNRLQQAIPGKSVNLQTKEKTKNTNAHITLGTVYALPHLNWSKYGSCIILDADISLNFPDYRSSEWFLHRLEKIFYLLPDDADLFILTKQPHHPIFSSFSHHLPDEWYVQQLKERKELQYPPYALFIKLSRRDLNATHGEALIKELLDSLPNFLREKQLKGTAARLETIPRHSARGYHYSVLLRILPPYPTALLLQLHEAYGDLWEVRDNPLDLLS